MLSPKSKIDLSKEIITISKISIISNLMAFGLTLSAVDKAYAEEGKNPPSMTVSHQVADKKFQNITAERREGYDVYQLRFGKSMIQIVPELGSNVIRMTQKIGDKEYEVLETPPDLKRMKSMEKPVCSFLYGVPVLFPWSNLWPEEIEVEGKKYKMPQEEVFIENGLLNHGLASKRPWDVIDAGENKDGVWIATEFNIDNPAFPKEWREAFGGLKINIKYTLNKDGLNMDVQYANNGKETRVTSFGFHPIFKVHGDWRKIQYNIPAGKRVVMDERRRPLKLVDPEGDYLLSDYRELNWEKSFKEGFVVNSFYTDVIKDDKGNTVISANFPEPELRLWMKMSEPFRHTAFLLIYQRGGINPEQDKFCEDLWPGKKPIISFEPYTSSVFAAEMAAKGLPWANAVILKPGEKFKGTVAFGLKSIKEVKEKEGGKIDGSEK